MNKHRYTFYFFIFTFIFSYQSSIFASGNNPVSKIAPKNTSPTHAAVATAHPLATQAGHDILKQGGNAFDAAIAVTATLAVVEPYSSGIGGGGFYLLHQASNDNYVMIDARERAPLNAHRDLYLDENKKVIPGASIKGALSAGIPGIPAALVHLAKRYGELTLSQSLAPAIMHAQQGFPVDKYYRRMAGFRLADLQDNEEASDIFLQQGELPELGYMVIQNDLANTLRQIAKFGNAGFYENDLAEKMVEDVRDNGGIWTKEDLLEYVVKQRAPNIKVYKGMRLVSASLPSSGGLVLTEILGILSELHIEKMTKAQRIHHIVEAMRLAYRDRAEFMGDSDFVEVPVDTLTSEKYSRLLAATINPEKATLSSSLKEVAQLTGKGSDTTHFSIIDERGNKVSATLSINYPFGSCFVAADTGVLLNDEMDDFVSKADVPNVYGLVGSTANSIEPGKRMLSSMTPSIVETRDRVAVIGTPGGSRIITMVLLAVLDFYENKDAQEIVNAGRYHHQYLPDKIIFEPGVFDEDLVKILTGLGHVTKELDDEYGNMHIIIMDKKTGTVEAASDRRGIGSAVVIP